MRICSGAGCLRVVADDIRFCDECKPQPTTSTVDDIRIHTLTDRERYAFLYSSARWTRLRNIVIRSQPFCSRCGNNISEIVDHIVPAGIAVVQASESGLYVDRYAGFFMRSNLHCLCRECHFRKTIEDKTHIGVWPSVVEKDSLKPKRVFSFG